MTSIYKIINLLTKDEYIGSAVSFKKRKWHHLYELKNNKHHSPKLQNSWNKYGSKKFEFIIVEPVNDVKNLIEREQWWIDNSNSTFNMSRIAGSPLGVKHTIISRLNMSNAHLGKKLTKESIQKRSLKQSGENHYSYGKKRPKEVVERVTKSLLEHYKNNASKKIGTTVSDEIRDRISKKLMRPIIQYSRDGVFIKEWRGAPEAERVLGIWASSICACCNETEKYKSAGGFVWKHKK